MSFTDKLVGLMARPGQDAQPKDEVPTLLKYGGRVLGIAAAFFSILFGVLGTLSIITINMRAVISGIVSILSGFIVMGIEAPCCCMFLDFVQQAAEKVDSRPYWNRAAFYCGIGLLPVIIDFSTSSFIAGGLIFATGVLYGMMALGKKATPEQMRNAATAAENSRTQQQQIGTRSNLVNNAQPISITGAPGFDSNV